MSRTMHHSRQLNVDIDSGIETEILMLSGRL